MANNTPQCDLGIVGLDVMSRNLALNFADHQIKVAVWDPDGASWPCDIIPGAASLADLTGSLRSPRTIVLSSGQNTQTDAVIDELVPLLGQGDILVDAGRSYFKDTARRSQRLAPNPVAFMALGIAGGEAGARRGASLTAGGSDDAPLRTRHLWEAIAATHDGQPCVSYVGSAAAAHFAEMVHAGIECGLAQLLSETFDLMKGILLLTDEELNDRSGAWHRGVLRGHLMEISGWLVNPGDGRTGRLQLAQRLERARKDETARWIAESAQELELQTPFMDAAVASQSPSTWERQRAMVASPVRQSRGSFEDDPESVLDELHGALCAGMIITYAEGLAVLEAAWRKHGFRFDSKEMVRLWRGCATLSTTVLDDISEALQTTPGLRHLLGDEDLSDKVMAAQEFLRHAVWRANELNTVVPALLAAVDYLDAQKEAWLPTNLVQLRPDEPA
jgi:6-phosphogluconate dehydrogenase